MRGSDRVYSIISGIIAHPFWGEFSSITEVKRGNFTQKTATDLHDESIDMSYV